MRRVLQILSNEAEVQAVPRVKPSLSFSSRLPLSLDDIIKTVYQAKPNQNVLQVRTPCWSSSLPGPDSRQQAWRNAEPEYATSFFSPEIELCTTSVNSRWPFLWSPSPILVSDLCFAKQGFTVPFTSRMSQEYGT
ncbi:hypothetical protein PS2_005670 [Malus domestica]|uniref:Uncharacterized protein n=1 Tax=Malus domestica TaxID=3750 RepID=A0A498ITB1_MALDO|nr:hypothetical protein DVH24_041920 [Malus domestica]